MESLGTSALYPLNRNSSSFDESLIFDFPSGAVRSTVIFPEVVKEALRAAGMNRASELDLDDRAIEDSMDLTEKVEGLWYSYYQRAHPDAREEIADSEKKIIFLTHFIQKSIEGSSRVEKDARKIIKLAEEKGLHHYYPTNEVITNIREALWNKKWCITKLAYRTAHAVSRAANPLILTGATMMVHDYYTYKEEQKEDNFFSEAHFQINMISSGVITGIGVLGKGLGLLLSRSQSFDPNSTRDYYQYIF